MDKEVGGMGVWTWGLMRARVGARAEAGVQALQSTNHVAGGFVILKWFSQIPF